MDARCREVRIVEGLLDTTRTAVRRQRAALEATERLAACLESARDHLLDVEPIRDRSLERVIEVLEPEPRKPKASRAEEQAKAKAIGISKVSLSWRTDGWATVIVQDFVTLTLAPSVGALLEQLIAVREVDEEGFPVFVAKDALRRALGVATHSRRARRPEQAVDQLVYRLRDEFQRAHLNRWFVDTKGGGVRLLLRGADPGPNAGTAAAPNGNAGGGRLGRVGMDHG